MPYFAEEKILIELKPALTVSIPSVVVGARHLSTGNKIIALISHILLEQKASDSIIVKKDAILAQRELFSGCGVPDEEIAEQKEVLTTAFAITAGQVQVAGPVSSTQSSFWFKLLHDHDYQVSWRDAVCV